MAIVNKPIIDFVETGNNINRLMTMAGMSVREMQEIFNFAYPQAIYKWLRGSSMPSLDNLVILASVLEVTLDDIVVYEKPCQKGM